MQSLLDADQHVVGLDDFSTGKCANLEEVRALVEPARWSRFRFIEGDVASADVCREAVAGVNAILHQAAIGSVPRSIEEPSVAPAATNTRTDGGSQRQHAGEPPSPPPAAVPH